MRRAAALLAEGTFIGDMILSGEEFPERTRLAAIERLTKRFGGALRGWWKFRDALAQYPEAPKPVADRDLESERMLAATAELTGVLVPCLSPESVGAVGIPPLFTPSEAQAVGPDFLREVLERDIVADAHPRRWMIFREEITGDDAPSTRPANTLLTQCWHHATPAQGKLMRAHYELLQVNPKATVSDAARSIGISPKTAHAQYQRLKAKVLGL